MTKPLRYGPRPGKKPNRRTGVGRLTAQTSTTYHIPLRRSTVAKPVKGKKSTPALHIHPVLKVGIEFTGERRPPSRHFRPVHVRGESVRAGDYEALNAHLVRKGFGLAIVKTPDGLVRKSYLVKTKRPPLDKKEIAKLEKWGLTSTELASFVGKSLGKDQLWKLYESLIMRRRATAAEARKIVSLEMTTKDRAIAEKLVKRWHLAFTRGR